MSSSETVHRPQPEGTRDIISALPLELLIHIVEFLAPEDIIQSQRVCLKHFSILGKIKKRSNLAQGIGV